MAFVVWLSRCSDLKVGEMFSQKPMIDGSRSLEITMLVAGIDFVLGQCAAGISQYASDTTIVELQLFGDESYPLWAVFYPGMMFQ